jgi:hypothetical protein
VYLVKAFEISERNESNICFIHRKSLTCKNITSDYPDYSFQEERVLEKWNGLKNDFSSQ